MELLSMWVLFSSFICHIIIIRGYVFIYNSVSSLATCATILTYGKLYAIFTERYVFVSSLIIFVVGSIVCATGPSSLAFILGRAIAGLGNAGILSGCNM